MANISVVSTTNAIKVDFGDYYGQLQFSKGTWRKHSILSIKLDGGVLINIEGERSWILSHDGTYGYQVDSVNSVTPTSNLDLYNKIVALIE